MTNTDKIISPRAGVGQGGGGEGSRAEPNSTLFLFVPLCPTENIFGSSSGTHRLRKRRPLSSKQESAATRFPVLEEANTEEKEAFFAFMEQLGPGHLLPE